MMHFQTFRRRFGDTVCGNLVLLNLSFFVLLIVTAIVLGLATSEPSTRTRYHAIPVALSQLYHDRTHDYTSYRSIAQSFQGSQPIDEVSKHWSENSPQDLDSTYFWLADDRGLSDVIYLGFLVLGPSMFSIFAAYMFLVLCGLIGYLVAFRDNVTALSLSAVGLLTLTAFLPVFVRAPGLTFAEQSVHISETRLIEFFAFIPALFLIVSLVLRPALNARWLVGLAMSAVLLAFALHIRSSITWLVLSLFFISLLYFSWTLFFRRDRAFLLVCALLAVAPVGALVGVKAYHQVAFHPEYLGERGPRTVWHNILMGLTHSPYFADSLGMAGVDDGEAVSAVLRHMESTSDDRLGPNWTRTDILNSLGGYGSFYQWNTYDFVARELVVASIQAAPREAARLYLVDKPLMVASLLACNATLWACGDMPASMPAIRVNPLSPFVLALLASVAIVCARSPETQRISPEVVKHLVFICLVLAAFGLFPSVVFYPALTQLGGVILFLLFPFFVAMQVVIFRLISRFRFGPNPID